MKSGWITHNGKKIFYCRYNSPLIEEMQVEVKEVDQELLIQPAGSVLLLIDTKGTILTPSAINLYMNHAIRCRKQLQKIAILGMEGVRKKILEIISKAANLAPVPFDSEKEAMEWLSKIT